VPDVPLEEVCPQCGRNMVLRHGRYGEYVSCTTDIPSHGASTMLRPHCGQTFPAERPARALPWSRRRVVLAVRIAGAGQELAEASALQDHHPAAVSQYSSCDVSGISAPSKSGRLMGSLW